MDQVNSIKTVLQSKDINFSTTIQNATKVLEKFQTTVNSTNVASNLLVNGMNVASSAMDQFRLSSSSVGIEYQSLLRILSNTSIFESVTDSIGNLTNSSNQAGQQVSNLTEQTSGLAKEFILAELSLQNFTASGALVQTVTDAISSYITTVASFGTILATSYQQVSQQLEQVILTGQTGFNQLQTSISSLFPTIQALSDSWRFATDAIRLTVGETRMVGVEFINILSEAFDQGTIYLQSFSAQLEESGSKSENFLVVFEKIRSKFSEIGNFINGTFVSSLLEMSEKLLNLNGNFQGFTDGASNIKKISEAITAGNSQLISFGQGLKENVTNKVSELGLSFNGAMSNANPFMSSLSQQFSSLNEVSGNALTLIKTNVSNFATTAGEKLASFGRRAVSEMTAFSTSFSQTGSVLPYVSNLIGKGFSGMEQVGSSAMNALSKVVMTNPIGIALGVIAAIIASVVLAWRSNFMNIQGVTQSAFEAIKNAMKTVEPVIKTIGTVFKFLGTMIIVGALFAVALLVDQFRATVFAGMTVINMAKAVGNAMMGLWAKIRGDNEGADAAFANMKGNINDIKLGFDDLKDNSAIKGVAESMSELGKESVNTSEQIKEVGASYKTSLDEAGQRIDALKGKYSELGQAAITAFAGEGMEQSSKRFEASNQIMERHADSIKVIKEKVGQELVAAEELTGQEQLSTQSEALSKMIVQAGQGAGEMLTIANANTQMLKDGKTLEGELLSEAQVKALQDQNNIIREGLMEQQNLIIEAAQSKLALGEKLSAEEYTAAKSANEALHRNQQEQLIANNEQTIALKEQMNATEDEVQKANFQQQIDALNLQNAQIQEQQATSAAELLLMMQQQEGLKAETVKQSMEQMGITTDEGLINMVQKYGESGLAIGGEMQLLAGILNQRGLEAKDSLITALQSGDIGQVGANLSQGALDGLAGLPEGMFMNGEAGKQAFITAIQNGKLDAMNIGGMLIGSLGTAIEGKKGELANKTNMTTQGVPDEMKKKEIDAIDAGKRVGSGFGSGLLSQTPNVTIGGTALALAAKAGLSLVEFHSTGLNIALGVASGIAAGQEDAVAAMRNLVNAVNAEAKKVAEIKSPSRLFRDTVGRFIAQGVAVGIEEDTEVAVASAKNMMTDIQQAVSGTTSHTNVPNLKIEHDVQNSLIGQMKEMIDTIKNMNVVLESGALVGGIGTQMDGFLGSRAGYAGRYR